MWFRSWLDVLGIGRVPQRLHASRHGDRYLGPTRRLLLESLEDRFLMAFSPAVMYPTGAIPEGVLAADFNGDGQLDLATANYRSSSSVSVLLGNPDGTFQPAQNSATGTWPVSVAAGDFNADGKLDLVTGNAYGWEVSVLLGNGNGTFQQPTNIPLVGYARSVAVGDFNGDGKLDLGVTLNGGYSYYGTTLTSSATVLLGTGSGTFAEPSATLLGYGWSNSAALADFNGDGKLDFATASDSYWSVDVVFGNGTGTFENPVGLNIGSAPNSVSAGDVNSDGKVDLVTANEGNDVSVLLGNGLGSFAAAQNYPVGATPYSVAMADFNSDGKVDLVTANGYTDTVSVLLGTGTGSFGVAEPYAVGSRPLFVAVGDFNGDLVPDLAVANERSDDVSVLLNDESWPPADAPSVSIGDVTVTEGNSGTTAATFTLSLSAAHSQRVTIHYETADGNGGATGGSDYTAASGDVIFDIGETFKTITIAVLGDRLPEGTEGFLVNLSAATNAIIADFQGVGAILDDEPRVGISDATVTEGNTGTRLAAFTMTLSAPYDAPVTVTYATADGSATAGNDYLSVSDTLTIPAGQTTGTIAVLVNGDRRAEAHETFFVDLIQATNASIANERVQGTILDDEPRISISDVSKKEGKKNQTTLFTFTVTLSAAYDQPVTISFRTADGAATTSDGDYVAKTGTLTFAPGETTKTITIEVKGDSKKEASETFYLDLFGNSGNSQFTKTRGIGTILNDD